MNPDERARIKAKDIFNHPWVKSFEKSEVDVDRKFSIDLIKASNENNKQQSSNVEEFKNTNSNTSTNYSYKNSSNRKDSKDKEIENLNKTLNLQKESLIQEALNSTNNEFSILNKNQDNNLFDKVLSQVIKKNGTLYLN